MRINPVYKAGSHRVGGSRHLVLAILAVLALIAPLADSVAYHKLAHPSLAPYKSLEVRSAAAQGPKLRVMFMGVTTILLEDGKNAIMTDGFFSRPGLKSFPAGKIKPDQARISYALSRAGVTKLDAVLTAHSHHDHAMDSPEVARRTGALLIGSKSTYYIAQGVKFPEERIKVISGGESFLFGRFTVTVIKSPHSPTPTDLLKGDITAPLRPPAWVWEYKEGGSYSYLIEHGERRILIHPSANYTPGFLRGVQADVIFLGIGRLGNQSYTLAKEYWQEVVQATRAKVIIPIHWDDFTRPLDKPLRRTPRLLDNVALGMRRIRRLAAANHVAVRLLPHFESVDISELNP